MVDQKCNGGPKKGQRWPSFMPITVAKSTSLQEGVRTGRNIK